MEGIKEYLETQKREFETTHHLMTVNNHFVHNPDPEYWNILLGDIKSNPDKWVGKNAFDFGCGCGRNLYNLSTLLDWANIDGCDISPSNASYAKNWFYENNKTSAKCETWENNGIDIQPTPRKYDFIMSHIVFQHISNYSVRFSIMSDMFNSLNEGGLCSLHFMDLDISSSYYEDSLEYKNCRVDDESYLVEDFKKIGFANIKIQTGSDYLTRAKSYYIKGEKI